MSLRKHTKLEPVVDLSPRWIKQVYKAQVIVLKKMAYLTGVLSYLDKKAPTSKRCHFLRSLFAVYQLQDMIDLDVPWWTYDAIEWMEQYFIEHPNSSVFEYGSGASTVWLAKRAQSVVSLEHDKHWFAALKNNLELFNHVTLMLEPPKQATHHSSLDYLSPKAKGLEFRAYVHAIERSPTPFNVIIVDGRCRVACLEQALIKLDKHGVILFDNSNRTRYQKALEQEGIQIKRFPGRVPGSPFKSETAIITKVV